MLGTVDFLRAVYGTVRLALRRVHPLAGPVVVAMVWVLALGSLLWVTREDDGGSPSDGAAAVDTDRGGAGTRSVGRDDGGGDGTGDDAGGPDGVGEVEWTEGSDGSPEDGIAAGDGGDGDGDAAGGDGDAAGGDGDDPTLESPGGPGRVTPPSSTGAPPSWDPQEPEEPGPGGPGSTTSSTTPPPTSGPSTSTTVPPSGGGLLDVLLGILFP